MKKQKINPENMFVLYDELEQECLNAVKYIEAFFADSIFQIELLRKEASGHGDYGIKEITIHRRLRLCRG